MHEIEHNIQLSGSMVKVARVFVLRCCLGDAALLVHKPHIVQVDFRRSNLLHERLLIGAPAHDLPGPAPPSRHTV